jgi:hypothetical protein
MYAAILALREVTAELTTMAERLDAAARSTG